MDDHFRAPLVDRNEAVNFDVAPAQRCQVAELAAVGGKNYAGERTLPVIGAEIQEHVAPARDKDPQDPPGDASGLTRMRARVVKIHAAAAFAGADDPRSFVMQARLPDRPPVGHERAETGSDEDDQRDYDNLLACHGNQN